MRIAVTVHHDDPGPNGDASSPIAPARVAYCDGDWDLCNLNEFGWSNLNVTPRYFAARTVGGKFLFGAACDFGSQKFRSGDGVTVAPGAFVIHLERLNVQGLMSN